MNQQETAEKVLGLGENLFYLFAMLASITVLICGIKHLRKKTHNQFFNEAGSAFRVFLLFVLGATALIFVPVYCISYSFDDNPKIIRTLLLSLHNAMRVFILDGEFDFIRDSIKGMCSVLHLFYSFYAAAIYVLAPAAFTFTIFLSIFQDSLARRRLRFHRNVNLYVFSCLNEESAAMAISILEQEKNETQKKDMLVFCNISLDEEKRKAQLDLMPYKQDKHSYVLPIREAVNEIDISQIRGKVTFFLMDKSETKNIQDATALTQQLMEKKKEKKMLERIWAQIRKIHRKPKKIKPQVKPIPRIFVYASTPASTPLIDALSGKALVHNETINNLKNIIEKECGPIGEIAEVSQKQLEKIGARIREKESFAISAPFSIMRVDIKTQMARQIVQEFQDTKTYDDCSASNKLTVTLLGLGGIGKEILENLLWMCQEYGRKLIINVFEMTGPELGKDPDAAHNPLYDRLAYEWPELIKTNRDWQQDSTKHPDTEADYDIRFFFGMNCFSNRFRSLFEKKNDKDKASNSDSARLLQSDLVICSLGDDDKNLEAAMMMRQLFVGNKMDNVKNEGDDGFYSQPMIYAVVYDNERADCISNQKDDNNQALKNYKGKPYHIKTVGSMRFQYSYEEITKLESIEKAALVHHIYWTLIDKKSEKDKEAKLGTDLNNYIHFEYYRQSSLTKAVHKEMLQERKMYIWKDTGNDQGPSEDAQCRCALCQSCITEHKDAPQCELTQSCITEQKKTPPCTLCQSCIAEHKKTSPRALCQSRITEHMRWNTYMRVNGYRYGEKKNEMAKIHQDLRSWIGLTKEERMKD